MMDSIRRRPPLSSCDFWILWAVLVASLLRKLTSFFAVYLVNIRHVLRKAIEPVLTR